MFKILYICILSLLAFRAANALNATEYEMFLLDIAKDHAFVDEFNSYMDTILKIEPDYFDYTPFKSVLYKFDCDTSSDPTKPRNVHELKPQDVKVFGALGDSLTAALGAKAFTIFGLALEYRELSWSIGGKNDLKKCVTLPNILKKFNPNVYGFNTGITFMPTAKQGKGFNSAVSGQEANHMGEQAQLLVDRLRADKNVDFENDWKVITLFIGGNDLCDYCKDKNLHSPKQYLNDIIEALDILYNNVPKTFVNLVTVLRATEVKHLNLYLVCNVLHKMTCPCAAFPKNEAEEKELLEVQKEYQNSIETLVNSGRYDRRDDFTVVIQPLFKDYSIPRLPDGSVDISMFAPDCFHLSTKGHTAASIGLWNNMLQPVGKKQTSSSHEEKILCPTKSSPYFFTSKNSRP